MKKILLLIVLTLSMSLFAACVIKSNPVEEEIPEGDELQSEMLTDSGAYQGRADNNFIEISISGVPEEHETKMFMLSDELKDEFEDLNLEVGAIVRFQYYVGDSGQDVIEEIELLEK